MVRLNTSSYSSTVGILTDSCDFVCLGDVYDEFGHKVDITEVKKPIVDLKYLQVKSYEQTLYGLVKSLAVTLVSDSCRKHHV